MTTEPVSTSLASRHVLSCFIASLALLSGCLSGCASGSAQPASPSSADTEAKPSDQAAAKPPVAPATDLPSASATSAAAQPPPPPASADKIGKATATDAPVLSRITQEDILAAVNANGEAFNACYTIGAGKAKTFSAKITVKATVGPTGAVNAVEIVNSSAKNSKVDACVQDAFKKLSFKRPNGSGATVFTFPLTYDGAQVQ